MQRIKLFFQNSFGLQKSKDDLLLPTTHLSSSSSSSFQEIEKSHANNCERTKSGLRIGALIFLGFSITTFLILFFTSNSVQEYTISLIQWMESLPELLSAGLMILLYAVGLVFFCPGTPFNLAAGFLYQIWLGCGVSILGSMIGAVLGFIFGRTIAREWVTKKIARYPKFKAIDWALHKRGLYIVILTRLSPLFPFPLLNYAFGITQINFLSYLVGTFIGSLPATIAYTYLGTLMRNLTDMWMGGSDSEEDNFQNIMLLIGGGAATLVSIVVITLITKRAITSATKEYEARKSSQENSFEEEVNEAKPLLSQTQS